MIYYQKRKHNHYLQTIEFFAMSVSDRFAISHINDNSAITRNDHVKKMILLITFCCLSGFLYFNISFHTPDKMDDYLSKTLQLHSAISETQPSEKNLSPPVSDASLQSRSNKKTDRFNTQIKTASKQYQVDPYLIKAIIMTESSYNPRAVSYRGAKGLMQLMPATAKELGVEDCFNPEHNINGGVKYFSKLLTRFRGNVDLALAAYNAGSTNVRRYRGVPPFKATRLYIKKVNEYYKLFKEEDAPRINRV